MITSNIIAIKIVHSNMLIITWLVLYKEKGSQNYFHPLLGCSVYTSF